MLFKHQCHIDHNLKVRPVSVAAVVKVKVNTDQLRCWLAGQCVFLSRLLKDRVLPLADKTFHLATKGWASSFELSGGFPSRPCGQGFQPSPIHSFIFLVPLLLLFPSCQSFHSVHRSEFKILGRSFDITTERKIAFICMFQGRKMSCS